MDRHLRLCEENYASLAECFMLKIRSGPFSAQLRDTGTLGCLGEPQSPWLRMARALLEREMDHVKNKIKEERPCTHPPNCVVQGRNQYGEWDRCLRCQTKLAYRPYTSKMESKKKEKKSRDVIYVPTAQPFEFKANQRAKAKAEAASSSLSSSSIQPEELQSSLVESNNQLLNGMTTVLSQAITPLVTGQQALLEMTQQSMNNQSILMSTVQQTQGAMAQALTEMTQQMRRTGDSIDALCD